MSTATSVEIALLLGLIDQAFDKKAWHGPNFRGSIRGLKAPDAAWRPAPGRKSIAEQVLHVAYWKYIVRRRLTGAKRGSFPIEGSNWFPVDAALREPEWKEYVSLLETEHRALREAVASLSPTDLSRTPSGSKVDNLSMIQGAACHDIYHAGQVELLKRLRMGS